MNVYHLYLFSGKKSAYYPYLPNDNKNAHYPYLFSDKKNAICYLVVRKMPMISGKKKAPHQYQFCFAGWWMDSLHEVWDISSPSGTPLPNLPEMCPQDGSPLSLVSVLPMLPAS